MTEYGRPTACPERGLLLSCSHDVARLAFFVLKHDPGRRHRAGTAQFARENGIDPWERDE